MNRKGAILIKEFIGRWFIVRIFGPQSSLVNTIDFIIQFLEWSIHIKGQELSYINAFINFQFASDMELDMQQIALSFLLTLKHNFVM